MADTFEPRIDNISYFESDKSNTKSLFQDSGEPEKKWSFEGYEKVKSYLAGFRVVQAASARSKRLIQFFICLFVASSLFLMALTTLPMILIMPEKFALMFSLASVALHLALSCLKENFEDYVKSLLDNKDYSSVATVYMVSLLFTLYASIYLGSYVVVLAACGIQMASVGWLMFEMFPRGSQGVVGIFKLGLKVCPGNILQV